MKLQCPANLKRQPDIFLEKLIVGAAIKATRADVAWERKTGRAMPCPYNFVNGHVTRNKLLSCNRSNSFGAEADIEVMIEVVKVDQCTVQDKRELGQIARVYDQVQITKECFVRVHSSSIIFK